MASTIDRQIDRPQAMPPGFVVKKGSKRRSMVSGARLDPNPLQHQHTPDPSI